MKVIGNLWTFGLDHRQIIPELFAGTGSLPRWSNRRQLEPCLIVTFNIEHALPHKALGRQVWPKSRCSSQLRRDEGPNQCNGSESRP